MMVVVRCHAFNRVSKTLQKQWLFHSYVDLDADNGSKTTAHSVL